MMILQAPRRKAVMQANCALFQLPLHRHLAVTHKSVIRGDVSHTSLLLAHRRCPTATPYHDHIPPRIIRISQKLPGHTDRQY
jgi:hypothetical protein